ncbi:MAG: hypothetical protein NC121_06050 [Blautia sp.]|nr:hypothetical protein [Blautia sp.]
MYNNEILFIDKFLSMLKKLGVSQIPFRNDEYRNGVYEMKKHFLEMQSLLDKSLYDIELLFIDGGEGDLAKGIMDCNDGNMISFELKNPYYEKASIKIESADADYILSDKSLKLSNDAIRELTLAFCKGAGVSVSVGMVD